MSFSYSERLNLRLLTLDSLEMRRLRADLILFFKILKVFVDADTSKFFERITPDFVTRGHRTPVFVLILDNISLQFELFQFGILFRQMLLKPSRFLVLRRVFLRLVLQNLYIFDCIFISF